MIISRAINLPSVLFKPLGKQTPSCDHRRPARYGRVQIYLGVTAREG